MYSDRRRVQIFVLTQSQAQSLRPAHSIPTTGASIEFWKDRRIITTGALVRWCAGHLVVLYEYRGRPSSDHGERSDRTARLRMMSSTMHRPAMHRMHVFDARATDDSVLMIVYDSVSTTFLVAPAAAAYSTHM